MSFLWLRYRRFHVSYALGWVAAAILIGLALSQVTAIALSPVAIVGIILVLFTSLYRRRWWSIVIIVCCGVLLGWWRGNEFNAQLGHYKKFIGQTVQVKGTIKDDPQYGDRGDQRFKVSDVVIDHQKLVGDVYVGTYSILDVKRGDTVVLQGRLRDGFGSYQASLSYATLSEVGFTADAVRETRDSFAAGVRNAVEEPAASLGIGFVVGQRSALPDELDDKLRIVGLTHIVVASGYNLTILVRFARRLLENHSKYLTALASSGLMVGFVAVSGLSPSMTRASLVTGLSLLAWYYGRRLHPLLIILYVAAATAWYYPVYLWADIGWHLSFLAFSGVLIVSPLLIRLIFQAHRPHPLVQVAVETSAAQVMTLPLILMVFGQLPVLSLLANVLVAPFIPLAMLLTTISGMLGMVAYPVAGFFGSAAEIVLGYMLAVVDWLALPSWSQINVYLTPHLMVLMYALIVITLLVVWRRLHFNFRASSVIE